jgi:hypothetical protein
MSRAIQQWLSTDEAGVELDLDALNHHVDRMAVSDLRLPVAVTDCR